MCRTPDECPICGEPAGFHVDHQFAVPPDWRSLYDEQHGRDDNGWIRHIYDDDRGARHQVLTKH